MPEPTAAPMAGEPAGNGETPAGGAAVTPGEEGSAPPSQTPTLDLSRQLDARFKAGYGKGAEKGRTEGLTSALEALGFVNLDEAVEHVTNWREQGDKPAVDVKQTPEYRELAKTHHSIAQKFDALSAEVTSLRAQADEARLDKLRAVALAKGVGQGGQLDAFVRMVGDRIQFDEQRKLRVMEQVDGTTFASDTSVEQWVEAFVLDNKFLLAVDQSRKGTGARQEPVRQAQATGPDYTAFGVRPPKRQG